MIIKLGEAEFCITLYALPLVGFDSVLGVQWLESLGSILCDWKAQTLQFSWKDKPVILNGLRKATLQPTTLKEIDKERREGQMLFVICSTEETTEPQQVPAEMSALVGEFTRIFRTSEHLPPPRDIEHHINLKEGTNPINVRPYR